MGTLDYMKFDVWNIVEPKIWFPETWKVVSISPDAGAKQSWVTTQKDKHRLRRNVEIFNVLIYHHFFN